MLHKYLEDWIRFPGKAGWYGIRGNIVLIGMPGSGKSTIGAGLAAKLGRNFIDTDTIIRKTEKMDLKDIVNERGLESFLKIQEYNILNLKAKDSVIATGGSVIYSNNSMTHLKKDGVVVYLKLGINELMKRQEPGRRYARNDEQSFIDLFEERLHLYDRFSDITVDCSDKNVDQIIKEVIKWISLYTLKFKSMK